MLTKQKKQKQKKSFKHMSECTHYNASIVNRETIDNDNDPRLSYNETRNNVILKNADQCHFSIIRFQLNGISDTPVFIPRVELGQTDVNKTTCEVSMEIFAPTSGVKKFKTRSIIFKPNVDTKKPSAPLIQQDFESEHYSVYTHSHWLKNVNDEMKALHDEIGAIGQPPMFTKDAGSNGLVHLFLDNTCHGDTASAMQIRLFFDSNMYGLFSNFHSIKRGDDLMNDLGCANSACEIVPMDHRGLANERKQDGNGHTHWKMSQDFESTSTLWSPVDSLVFTTNLIPINPEISGNPMVFEDGKLQTQSSDNATELAIADLQAALQSADGYNGLLTHDPSNEHRLADFTSQKNCDLRNISVNAHHRNRLDGKLHPLKPFNNGSASMKMMFEKKLFH